MIIIVASETFRGPPWVDVITAREVDVTQTDIPFRAPPYKEKCTATLQSPSFYQR